MNKYEAIIEFTQLIMQHIKHDDCNRNRENATQIIKMLADCLVTEVKNG
jgi:hypothetical protein